MALYSDLPLKRYADTIEHSIELCMIRNRNIPSSEFTVSRSHNSLKLLSREKIIILNYLQLINKNILVLLILISKALISLQNSFF